MTTVQDIVDRVGALPPLPDTALKLMEAINDPRSDVEQIVETIKYDQAVTTEVLKLCNSAYFGLSHEITSLSEAMVRLGTVKVLQLVVSVHTCALLSKEQRGYGLDPGILWKHSVAVAVASTLVGAKIKQPNKGLLFTASLLHDIGKVVLNEYVAEDFVEIMEMVQNRKCSFVEAEHEVLGFSHAEIGAVVGEHWNLPQSLIDCIRYHHEPSALNPPDPLVDAVYIANTVCLLMGVGVGEDGLYSRADADVLARHGFQERDLEMVGMEMLIELRRVEEMFSSTAAKA